MADCFEGKQFQKLDKKHDRNSFDCGVEEFNHFLKKHARKHQQYHASTTWVLLAEDEKTILGFYTFLISRIKQDILPQALTKRHPPHDLPIIHLGRLARDLCARGKGVGELLLLDVLHRTFEISKNTAIHGVEVIAKD